MLGWRGACPARSCGRGEELDALAFEPLPIRGRLGQFLRAGSEAFVERGLDLLSQGLVAVLGDGDVLVAVGDELFGDSDGDGSTVAVLTS